MSLFVKADFSVSSDYNYQEIPPNSNYHFDSWKISL